MASIIVLFLILNLHLTIKSAEMDSCILDVEQNYNRIAGGDVIKSDISLPGFRYCSSKYTNDSLSISCLAGIKQENCRGPPDPRKAWFIQCLAKKLIAYDFNVPVYIVHGPIPQRYHRLKNELIHANIRHIHVHSNHMAQNLSSVALNKFFHETFSNSTPEEKAECLKVYSYTKKSMGEVHCNRGVVIPNVVLAVGMEHTDILRKISDCELNNKNCATVGANPWNRYKRNFSVT